MTRNIKNVAGGAEPGGGRFDQVSIALHWLTVLLIVVQYGSLWLHEAAHHASNFAVATLSVHRSMGMVTWLVAIFRLVWRRYSADVPPFPQSMPKLQQAIARTNEYGLYILLLVQPITGFARVVLRGQPFELLFWHVPALIEPNAALRDLFAQAHEIGGNLLLLLIGLHAGAALFHRLVLRDGVLQRMLPRPLAQKKLTLTLVKSRPE